ncbi:MAG: hypothetical protein KFF73_17220 [Cyclobacteriaceae bacterium]|nr:hypothetical protein [Cyclobacteriaceae bacterium]
MLFIFTFPSAVFAQSSFFNVLEYGAINDGRTLNTTAIQETINACAKSGGGTVYFPAGRYVSGTLFLKSHVKLHLDAGAVLEGSRNLENYPVTLTGIRSYTGHRAICFSLISQKYTCGPIPSMPSPWVTWSVPS